MQILIVGPLVLSRSFSVRNPLTSYLISIGRNGEFAHILMEDIYWSTLKKMQTLVDRLRTARDVPEPQHEEEFAGEMAY